MALIDIGKIKESVEKSADEIKKSLTEAAEKLPDPAKDSISQSMKAMAEKYQNMLDSLKAKGDELAATGKERADETKAAINDALRDEKSSEAVFLVRDALRIMYCLMLIDGTVYAEEGAKYSEIGLACDQDFDRYKKQLIDECTAMAQSESAQGVEFVSLESGDSEEYYEQIRDYVGDLITEEDFYRTEGVRAKDLIWNLLAIAHSEGEYSEDEQQLIRFIAAKTGVDDATLFEMEQTFKA